jgi:hypothetical protein
VRPRAAAHRKQGKHLEDIRRIKKNFGQILRDKEPIDNEVLIHNEPPAFHNLEELRL